MKIKICTQITFSAFGKDHCLYTDKESQDELAYYKKEIEKICPTAHISQVCKVTITKEKFLLNNLESLVDWNLKINNLQQ